MFGKEAHQLGLYDQAIQWFKLAVEISSSFDLTEEEQSLIPRLRASIVEVRIRKFYSFNILLQIDIHV